VIAGIITNFAAEGTARDASDRGYRVIVLADCCESVTDEMHQFAIPAIGEVVNAADFRESIAALQSIAKRVACALAEPPTSAGAQPANHDKATPVSWVIRRRDATR
jgi:hypothetical protein